MKKLSKVVALAAATLLVGSAVFADGVKFKNELSSGVVSINTADGSKSLDSWTNKTQVEYLSEKVDAKIKVTFKAVPGGSENNVNYTLPKAVKLDGYIEYRPVQWLTFGFNDTINTTASYLPAYDDNYGEGNFGGLFAVCVRPVKGLRIAAGVEEMTVFNPLTVKGKVGADYLTDTFSVGATFIADPANNAMNSAIGGSFTGIKDVYLTGSFIYNGAFEGVKGNLVAVGASYAGIKNLFVAVDAVVQCADTVDFYQGFYANYDITKAVFAELYENVVDTGSLALTIGGNAGYKFAKVNTVKAGVCVAVAGGDTTISFPVKWTVKF